MDVKQHRPIFADRVKITTEWSAGANVTKTFAKYGWVPPSVAAARAQTDVADGDTGSGHGQDAVQNPRN